MATNITIGARDVLLVADVQNDFCPGGALPVPQGDTISPSSIMSRGASPMWC